MTEHTLLGEGHWLVITDDGERNYEIEHLSECPTSEWQTGLDGIPPVLCYECGIGSLWEAVGSEGIPDIETLPPGRYLLGIHVEHTPSLPTNGGEEWDAWIEVVR